MTGDLTYAAILCLCHPLATHGSLRRPRLQQDCDKDNDPTRGKAIGEELLDGQTWRFELGKGEVHDQGMR
jgi:hypothetical protein